MEFTHEELDLLSQALNTALVSKSYTRDKMDKLAALADRLDFSGKLTRFLDLGRAGANSLSENHPERGDWLRLGRELSDANKFPNWPKERKSKKVAA